MVSIYSLHIEQQLWLVFCVVLASLSHEYSSLQLDLRPQNISVPLSTQHQCSIVHTTSVFHCPHSISVPLSTQHQCSIVHAASVFHCHTTSVFNVHTTSVFHCPHNISVPLSTHQCSFVHTTSVFHCSHISVPQFTEYKCSIIQRSSMFDRMCSIIHILGSSQWPTIQRPGEGGEGYCPNQNSNP